MESMEDYKDLYEASFKKFRVGDIVKGTVISVDENGAVIDLNYYAPGFIAVDEFSDNPDFSIEDELLHQLHDSCIHTAFHGSLLLALPCGTSLPYLSTWISPL